MSPVLTTARSFLAAMHCSWLFGGAVKRVRAGRYQEADPILREVLTRLSSPKLDAKLPHVASLVVTANILAAQIALKLGDRERARETLRAGLATWGSTDAGTNGSLTETLQWARTTLQTLDS
jgi:predicted Zn-dependent protease